MEKLSRARYTREFKDKAVRLVTNGGRVSDVARNLGLPIKTLSNRPRQAKNGDGSQAASRSVSQEQMELSRLRAEPARVKMERDILKKGGGVLREGVAVKYAHIQRHRDRVPVSAPCAALGVGERGSHQFVRRRARRPAEGGARVERCSPTSARSTPRRREPMDGRGSTASRAGAAFGSGRSGLKR